MTDTYIVQVEHLDGTVARLRIASLNGVDYASTRSFALRLLFDAARRRGEAELQDLQRWRYATEDPTEQAAREELVYTRRQALSQSRDSALARAFGDRDGPYSEPWFHENARNYIAHVALSARSHHELSDEALSARRRAVEDRTTQATPPPEHAATQCQAAWLDCLHAYTLTLTSTDAAWLSHLQVGEIFRSTACDLALEPDAPSF